MVQLSFFSITGWGIGLYYCDIEWFALETNRDHAVIFEIASKYCTLDSFVDQDGYSISSEGFLPTVVDIMVIWPYSQGQSMASQPTDSTVLYSSLNNFLLNLMLAENILNIQCKT